MEQEFNTSSDGPLQKPYLKVSAIRRRWVGIVIASIVVFIAILLPLPPPLAANRIGSFCHRRWHSRLVII